MDELYPLVYDELHRLARRYMSREKQGHTLQTTALINEAYVRLVDQRNVHWANRSHFFAISAQIMRRILINHARDNAAEKRGGKLARMNIDDAVIVSPEKSLDLLALDEALDRLASFDQTKSRIVELRSFGGLTIEETAEVLGIAPPTVSLHWRLARAWLQKEILGRRDSK